jgi:hypothetical protein
LYELERVVAHEGLAIDAPTWTAAHAYHNTVQRLHNRAAHGWGIVTGLEVAPTEPPSRAVLVAPGVAIDRDGATICVPHALRVEVRHTQPGVLCLVLRFAQRPGPAEDGNPASRVGDFFEILEVRPPLAPGDIELARLEVGSERTLFREPRNRISPRLGEVDLRYRREVSPRPVEALTIGRLAAVDAAAAEVHHRALSNLARELQASAPFVVQLVENVRAEEAVGLCDLLYVGGAGELRLTPREGALLLGFVRSGGVVFAEPCAEMETARQENGRFVASFRRLLADLKVDLAALETTHPLFTARHVFGRPPEGAGGHAPLLGNGTIIVSANDYGCYWEGGSREHPVAREPIRGAIEFGANLVWWTAEQMRVAHVADALQRSKGLEEPLLASPPR